MSAPWQHDRGSVVLSWLFKIALVLCLLGLVAFDGIAVAVARVSSADAATTVATEAASQYHTSHSVTQAYQAAKQTATQNGVSLAAQDLVIYPDGSAEATVHRPVSTIVLKLLPFARSLTEVTSTSTVPAPTQ